MQINIHNEHKYVSIWLTRAESIDIELRESLTPLFKRYKDQKYRVVIFESGKEDLPTLTRSLLLCNLKNKASPDTNKK